MVMKQDVEYMNDVLTKSVDIIIFKYFNMYSAGAAPENFSRGGGVQP